MELVVRMVIVDWRTVLDCRRVVHYGKLRTRQDSPYEPFLLRFVPWRLLASLLD